MYGDRVVFSPRWWNRSSRPLSMLRNILQITLTVMTISKWRENVCVRECVRQRERERRGMTSRGVTSELSSIRFHSLSLFLSYVLYIYIIWKLPTTFYDPTPLFLRTPRFLRLLETPVTSVSQLFGARSARRALSGNGWSIDRAIRWSIV